MVVTEISIPKRPAKENVIIIPAIIIIAGKAVDSKLIASPWITFVPCPVVDDFAILWTGL